MKAAVINYTLRDLFERDVPGTLRALRQMGIRYCQISGDYGHSAAEWKRMLDGEGLVGIGAHIGIDRIENDLDRLADDMATMGIDTVVLPWIPEERYRHGWDRFARQLETLGQRLREKGLAFAYHNHAFELESLQDGKPGLDILFDTTDPDLVGAEIDVYWVQYGGGDPVDYVRRYGPRMRYLHAKDMGPGPQRPFYEVGRGILDWDGILGEAERTGVEFAVIELDTCPHPPLESVRMSFEYLLSRGLTPE